MMRLATVIACILLAGAANIGASALAGTGKMFPTYHPPKMQTSCTDGACKGDDPRSELPCQGLLCGFASAKSLQPPVTAAQAEAAARSHEAQAAAPVAAAAELASERVKQKGTVKGVAKTRTPPDRGPSETHAAPRAAQEAAR